MTTRWMGREVEVVGHSTSYGKGRTREVYTFVIEHGALVLVRWRREALPSGRHRRWRLIDSVPQAPFDRVLLSNALAQEIVQSVTTGLKVQVANREWLPTDGYLLRQLDVPAP
jgi:hypothetical protein